MIEKRFTPDDVLASPGTTLGLLFARSKVAILPEHGIIYLHDETRVLGHCTLDVEALEQLRDTLITLLGAGAPLTAQKIAASLAAGRATVSGDDDTESRSS